MKVKTAEQYLARYRRRGAERSPKTNIGDELQGLRNRCWPQDDHAFRSKPDHASRAVALPLTPLGVKPRPTQPIHPATSPLNMYQRTARYVAQNGGGNLTDRQARRAKHKWGRAIAASERRTP